MIRKLKNKINDEYEFNKYYLFNKKWLKEYIETFGFESVFNKIDKRNYNYSYKGFKYNLIKILKENSLNKEAFNTNNKISQKLITPAQVIPIEKKYEYENENESKKINNIDLIFPEDFELINEEIFNYLAKENLFNNIYKKEEQEYEVLIGDNLIIIKNKKMNNIFMVYSLNNKDEYSLDYIIQYKEELLFYNNIRNYIINKGGIENFIRKTNLLQNQEKMKEIIDETKKLIGIFKDMKISLKNKDNNNEIQGIDNYRRNNNENREEDDKAK